MYLQKHVKTEQYSPYRALPEPRNYHVQYVHEYMYRIAGYIGGNNIWRIARKRKKIAIGGYKFGGYGTISTPSPGIGAILADLILAV